MILPIESDRGVGNNFGHSPSRLPRIRKASGTSCDQLVEQADLGHYLAVQPARSFNGMVEYGVCKSHLNIAVYRCESLGAAVNGSG